MCTASFTLVFTRAEVQLKGLDVCRPYESGEIVVQSFNSVLTLAHLTRVSDGLVLVQNEALRDTCCHVKNIPRPSLQVFPVVAAVDIPARVLLPLLLTSICTATCCAVGVAVMQGVRLPNLGRCKVVQAMTWGRLWHA